MRFGLASKWLAIKHTIAVALPHTLSLSLCLCLCLALSGNKCDLNAIEKMHEWQDEIRCSLGFLWVMQPMQLNTICSRPIIVLPPSLVPPSLSMPLHFSHTRVFSRVSINYEREQSMALPGDKNEKLIKMLRNMHGTISAGYGVGCGPRPQRLQFVHSLPPCSTLLLLLLLLLASTECSLCVACGSTRLHLGHFAASFEYFA